MMLRILLWLLLVAGSAPALAAGGDWLGSAKAKLGLGGSAQPEFLDPDQAFVFSAAPGPNGTVHTEWIVADGYYLYTDKFKFSTTDPGLGAGTPAVPHTEVTDDPYFGPTRIVKGEFAIDVPIAGATAGRTVNLQAAYQGCAEDGICYPPIRKTLVVTFPAASGADPAATAPPAAGGSASDTVSAGPMAAGATPGAAAALPMSESDSLAARLRESGGLSALAAFFGFGLLLSFTPCVLPMVPILSGLIVGSGPGLTARRGFLLSLVYVVSMAGAYAVAGVIAGRFGNNLQATLQHPAVIVAFAALFVVLAAAMFDLFHLQLPVALQTRLSAASARQRAGSLAGVAIMGVLSAVIVSPCVAPPLAGALLYIASTGDAIYGGTALFALGLGMGAPLLVIGGSAGHWLPRAGAWMESVKRLFGVLLLGTAIWLLERILPGPAALALWGVLLVCAGVAFGALDALPAAAGGWQKITRGAALATVVWGGAALVGAAAGGTSVLQPLAAVASTRTAAAAAGFSYRPVKGAEGLQSALALARTQGKPVLVDFFAEWCVECHALERTTFVDAGVRAELGAMTVLRADVTANDALDQALLRQLGLFGPPAILLYGTDGTERRDLRVVGYIDAAGLRDRLVALRPALASR